MTLRKTLNIALTLLLLGVVCYIGFMTTKRYYRDYVYSFFVTYERQLTEPYTLNDNLKARTDATAQFISSNLELKTPAQRLNAHVQRLMGKQMISYGGSSMVWLKSGQLYDLMPDNDTVRKNRTATLEGIRVLNEKLGPMGIPVLYGYAHTGLYDGAELPDGVSDENNEIADDIVARLEGFGVPTIDSRKIMRDAGLPLDQIIFRADAHWQPRAAFEMYARMVDLLNEKTTIKADKSAADLSRFNIEVLPKAHISDIGNRLGAEVIEPDDFPLITPNFDTFIKRDILKGYDMIASEGTFEDVVLEKAALPEAKGVEYTNCFNYYGQHPEVVYYHNPSAPEGRLLIIKDSFGTPTSSFMALAVRDVCAIDLRKTIKKIEDYVEEFKPDAVMFVQCQEVMRGANFVFVNQ